MINKTIFWQIERYIQKLKYLSNQQFWSLIKKNPFSQDINNLIIWGKDIEVCKCLCKIIKNGSHKNLNWVAFNVFLKFCDSTITFGS